MSRPRLLATVWILLGPAAAASAAQPEGQELFERVYPQHFRFLKEWFGSRLSKPERAELTRLLRKMAEGL